MDIINPVSCAHDGCTHLVEFLVGAETVNPLEVCGPDLEWALAQHDINDAPWGGIGSRKVTVRAHSGHARSTQQPMRTLPETLTHRL